MIAQYPLICGNSQRKKCLFPIEVAILSNFHLNMQKATVGTETILVIVFLVSFIFSPTYFTMWQMTVAHLIFLAHNLYFFITFLFRGPKITVYAMKLDFLFCNIYCILAHCVLYVIYHLCIVRYLTFQPNNASCEGLQQFRSNANNKSVSREGLLGDVCIQAQWMLSLLPLGSAVTIKGWMVGCSQLKSGMREGYLAVFSLLHISTFELSRNHSVFYNFFDRQNPLHPQSHALLLDFQ